MKSAPCIHVDEFLKHTTQTYSQDSLTTYERNHPEFGLWKEQVLDLGHIRIYQHNAVLKNKVNVHFTDDGVGNYVHHCMSLEGEMGAHFIENHTLSAVLNPKSYHNLFLPCSEYLLSMGTSFTNIHLEVKREYYADLLSDSEKWSAELKSKLENGDAYYTGELHLSPSMLRIIHSIFESPLSGCLKKLLIEANVHELIALQLHNSVSVSMVNPSTKDLFVDIKKYLDKTYLQPHTLRDIARHFGINEFALKRGFREYFQTTVFDYLLLKRLEHSYVLLQSTSKTIEEISSIVGYKYPNHFSAAFKKKFGVTPIRVR